MGTQVLVFRKFLNEEKDSYVSVTSEQVEYQIGEDRKVSYVVVNLNMSDANQKVNFEYVIDNESDKEYEEIMSELDVIRSAVTTAMDELVDAYSKMKFSALDKDEADATS